MNRIDFILFNLDVKGVPTLDYFTLVLSGTAHYVSLFFLSVSNKNKRILQYSFFLQY